MSLTEKPTLSESENVLRSNDACSPWQQAIIAAELDRLRDELDRHKAENARLRLFYEQSMAQSRELYGDEFENSDKEPTT
jgi:hypothetical protein